MKCTEIKQSPAIDGKAVALKGRFLKTAKLRSEHFESLETPEAFIGKFRASGVKADLFTFVQEIHDPVPHFDFLHVSDQLAVLPISTYEHWFNKQLYFKPRNKLRKALKSGVEVKLLPFTDELVAQIKAVYDETPIRQGKRNWNYGKDLETLKREHSTFLDRSEFIGAFFRDELIGFAKLTYSGKSAIFMNIVAKNSHRNKAPSNALIAKSVELCSGRNLSCLAYGMWRGRGLQDFKVANGFQRHEIPRYFVPFTLKGRIALQLGFHLKPIDHVPRWCIELASRLRSQLLALRIRHAASAVNKVPSSSEDSLNSKRAIREAPGGQ